MYPEHIVILLVTGTVAGFAGGLLGLGGAFIMTPVQFIVYTAMGLPDDLAIRRLLVPACWWFYLRPSAVPGGITVIKPYGGGLVLSWVLAAWFLPWVGRRWRRTSRAQPSR